MIQLRPILGNIHLVSTLDGSDTTDAALLQDDMADVSCYWPPHFVVKPVPLVASALGPEPELPTGTFAYLTLHRPRTA